MSWLAVVHMWVCVDKFGVLAAVHTLGCHGCSNEVPQVMLMRITHGIDKDAERQV